MGSAWRRGSPGCASSGPAAARPRSRRFLRPRTPLCRGARAAAAGGLPPRSLAWPTRPLHVTYGSR